MLQTCRRDRRPSLFAEIERERKTCAEFVSAMNARPGNAKKTKKQMTTFVRTGPKDGGQSNMKDLVALLNNASPSRTHRHKTRTKSKLAAAVAKGNTLANLFTLWQIYQCDGNAPCVSHRRLARVLSLGHLPPMVDAPRYIRDGFVRAVLILSIDSPRNVSYRQGKGAPLRVSIVCLVPFMLTRPKRRRKC